MLHRIGFGMATHKAFPQQGFLASLERSGSGGTGTPLPPALARLPLAADAGEHPALLIQLLRTRREVLQASFHTEQVADELRRYQKFARPGQPSPSAVRLRQQQAAARQAASVARQRFVQAAAALVREAAIEVPPRQSLEAFVMRWIDLNIPADIESAG